MKQVTCTLTGIGRDEASRVFGRTLAAFDAEEQPAGATSTVLLLRGRAGGSALGRLLAQVSVYADHLVCLEIT